MKYILNDKTIWDPPAQLVGVPCVCELNLFNLISMKHNVLVIAGITTWSCKRCFEFFEYILIKSHLIFDFKVVVVVLNWYPTVPSLWQSHLRISDKEGDWGHVFYLGAHAPAVTKTEPIRNRKTDWKWRLAFQCKTNCDLGTSLVKVKPYRKIIEDNCCSIISVSRYCPYVNHNTQSLHCG